MDINGIARLAGVSRATVSRYLNDGYVSKEKSDLIAKAIEETGYVPSQQARTLRTGKTKLVGVVIPKINSASVGRMVAGVSDVLGEGGYQVLLGNTENDEHAEIDYITLFAQTNKADGIILIGTVITPQHVQAMRDARVPVVVLSQKIREFSCVYHADYTAMLELSLHVLKTSRHPAFIGVREEDVATGKMRHKAFLDACAQRSVAVPDDAHLSGGFTIEYGHALAEKILAAHPETDAVLCATDNIAYGATMCLREHGLRIPEDVQVTGVGDSTYSAVSVPALTTVHHYYKTSGVEAARMLLDAMESQDMTHRELKMGYELVLRESTR